ncbi:MAG TPA: hypothetical protein VEJ18_14255, partial [Planctomycetota bacterium]|nr:hypothetical protein [Planctomycetota bacterium]
LHMFEIDTGRRLGVDAPILEGATPQLLHVAPDVAVLMAEGREAVAYELPSGALRWKVDLAHTSLRAAEVTSAGLVLLGLRRLAAEPDEVPFLAVVDMKSGKFLRLKEKLEVADPRFLLAEGSTAYIVSREADGRFAVRHVDLGDLSSGWSAAAGGGRDSTLLPPALTEGHVVVMSFAQAPDGKYGYEAALLDRAGKHVQNIEGGRTFDRPPTGVVRPGGVVFTVDNRVEFYR